MFTGGLFNDSINDLDNVWSAVEKRLPKEERTSQKSQFSFHHEKDADESARHQSKLASIEKVLDVNKCGGVVNVADDTVNNITGVFDEESIPVKVKLKDLSSKTNKTVVTLRFDRAFGSMGMLVDGTTVKDVKSESWASKSGVTEGWKILKVGRQGVTPLNCWEKIQEIKARFPMFNISFTNLNTTDVEILKKMRRERVKQRRIQSMKRKGSRDRKVGHKQKPCHKERKPREKKRVLITRSDPNHTCRKKDSPLRKETKRRVSRINTESTMKYKLNSTVL